MDASLRTKVLKRTTNLDAYTLYKAALEWSLTDPIIIEKREDLKSEDWKKQISLYDHQVNNLITFCRRLPVTLLADDVGLGKTISAGLIMSELISRGRISKILIVCPKLLLPQWEEELRTKFGIKAVQAIGKEIIETDLSDGTSALITTYNSARLYLDRIAENGFDMLILDEAHKLRNLYGVDKVPQVAQRFYEALKNRMFKYVLMLTATPIQNRLWDLYSLVDLLTVAKGHENPFGSSGMFARKFIADKREDARKLKLEAQEEFRSIVYGYMSRVRRGDANLHFPERKVQLHTVEPTPEELELIDVIKEPIQKLNPLVQISILQALVSSPEALSSQLNKMTEKHPELISLASEVKAIVNRNFLSSKLSGLKVLVEKLKTEQSDNWRMVIFTERIETQTTIQNFLEEQGISCGIINGSSSGKNQETIQMFRTNPPKIHAIISTRAGSEGVNLQAANVLVNYDLPWNPMIVEQRIGRIQRLASEYENVCIFNITLKGTFEEYIVARLMEKLQMASHAIGDIESLLKASDMEENDDDGAANFEEKIRTLVLDSLAGKDVEHATIMATKSIEDAKNKLQIEEENINSMLGSMNGDGGPECPKLPVNIKSMPIDSFVLNALKNLGASISSQSNGSYISELNGRREIIEFQDNKDQLSLTGTLYKVGSPAFERLVSKFSNNGLHCIDDIDLEIEKITEKITNSWVQSFNGEFNKFDLEAVYNHFDGTALLKVRITVAHDSYERLIEIQCSPQDHFILTDKDISSMNEMLSDPFKIGINSELLSKKALEDRGVSEFCRFYEQRKAQEMKAAGNDERKRKKLEDDFTPRIEILLVGLSGKLSRHLKLNVSYNLGEKTEYKSNLTIIPSLLEILKKPEMSICAVTQIEVPEECLGQCDISGQRVLLHKLIKSEITNRKGLPEYILKCELSGKLGLTDELERSALTDKLISKILLKTSTISGKKAEPSFFAKCDFTNIEALEGELSKSQISNKLYRTDEGFRSVVSGKAGHKSEFITCAETNDPLLYSEGERCEVTGKIVRPGILDICTITNKKVMPHELYKCTVSGKKALKNLFVFSSISGVPLLETEAIKSNDGKFCTPLEAKKCFWSERQCHPEDIRICELTSIPIYVEFATNNGKIYLEVLFSLLSGSVKKYEQIDSWDSIAIIVAKINGNKKCKVETATLSPTSNQLAVCIEVKTLLGLKIRYIGLVYSLRDKSILGSFTIGKREANTWKVEN